MAKKVGSPRRRTQTWATVHAHAAGLDVGSRFHVAAVPADCCAEPVRTFQTFTGDLYRLAQWLQSVGITTVAMESTGVYWIPVFQILEQQGLEVLLVNAQHVKNVPGRKTDVNDAQWLQQLHQYGLLRGSFHPPAALAALRHYLRHRERLVEYAAAHIQHMQKALMQMNVQLHHVLTDITGVTGMAILRAMVAGNHDPARLAAYRDARCKAALTTVRQALTGHYTEEHLLALRQALELYDTYQEKIAECDHAVEALLHRLRRPEVNIDALPAARCQGKHQGNQPHFAVREALYGLVGTDLSQLHGLGPYTALMLVGECGTDMSRWPTVKHFTSWLTLSPGNKTTGGRKLSSKTRRSSSRAAHLLRRAAVNVGKTDTALGAFYRRLSARTGKAKAVTATARKIAVLYYNALRYGMEYCDPGAHYYEEQYRTRVFQGLQRRARILGFVLVPEANA